MRYFWLSLLLLLLTACHTAPSPQTVVTKPTSTNQATKDAAVRDLTRDEGAGGHTLRRHVGRTEAELRDRLRSERRIAAASTYTDRDTAERAVGTAIEQQQARIESWIGRAGGHPNLVLDYDADRPLGSTMRRGEDRSTPCSHAVVVLKWIESRDYYVLTSYPECR